jgi:pimeloyl-ACP methyl ester carboxylesterase
MSQEPELRRVETNGVTLRVAAAGEGPLVILVHGWPELWYSWRHQIGPLAAAGFQVVAPDVRGYGGSDKPHEVEAYDMRTLTSDVAGLIDALGAEQAVLVGHDWGAPICWNTAVLHPSRIRAVAGLSVPFRPRGPMSAVDLYRKVYAGRFFYQLYFQEEGVAEAELEADVRASLRKIFYSVSGDAERATRALAREEGRGFLDGLVDPEPLPPWMSEEEIEYFAEAFEKGGFRGPLNRYRCLQRDWEDLVELEGATIRQPSFFMAGSKDPVRHFMPGMDLYADPGAFCDDFRGGVLVEGEGHWVQQEAPAEVTRALLGFLEGI